MSERFNPDQFAVDTDRDFPGYLSAWRFAVANVGNLESELERAFLAHWTFATYRGGWSSYGGVHPGGEIAKYDLTAQRWIDEYRVDFALDVLSSRGVVATTAVIEVDGFSYHGDRDSFELDRARDQFFHAAGFTVFRFTHRGLKQRQPLANLLAWASNAEPRVEPPSTTFDLVRFIRNEVEGAIYAAAEDPSEMKRRIMLVWESGQLNSQETEEWIVLAGLESA